MPKRYYGNPTNGDDDLLDDIPRWALVCYTVRTKYCRD